jgi:DNA-binding MarR family transcriptional regulator
LRKLRTSKPPKLYLISRLRVNVLLQVVDNPGITQKEISKTLEESQQQIGKVLKVLNEMGLIRASRKHSGKIIKYSISQRGLELAVHLDKAYQILEMPPFEFKNPIQTDFIKVEPEGF